MNQVECQRALKQFISDNESTLVSGFYHQGSYRSISDIATSPLVPPRDYYHFLVTVRSASESQGDVRTSRSVSKKIYQCTIGIVDAAITQSSEDVPYEKMSNDFRLMCDRLVGLIRSASSFSYNGVKFRLSEPDRSVSVENRDRTWSGDYAILFSTLSFTMEEC